MKMSFLARRAVHFPLIEFDVKNQENIFILLQHETNKYVPERYFSIQQMDH